VARRPRGSLETPNGCALRRCSISSTAISRFQVATLSLNRTSTRSRFRFAASRTHRRTAARRPRRCRFYRVVDQPHMTLVDARCVVRRLDLARRGGLPVLGCRRRGCTIAAAGGCAGRTCHILVRSTPAGQTRAGLRRAEWRSEQPHRGRPGRGLGERVDMTRRHASATDRSASPRSTG
jgi:hypothetical protein